MATCTGRPGRLTRRLRPVLVVGLGLGLLATLTPTAAAAPPATIDPSLVTVIVRLQPGGDVDANVQRATAEGARTRFRYYTALRGFAVQVPQQAVAAMRRLPQVVSVELDAPVQASATQTPAEWGLDRIDQRALPLSGSYSYPSAGSGVTAYVLDTGILAGHDEFGDRVRPGYSAVNDGRAATTDCNGHGTHVAGTLAGRGYGVAKQAELVPVRVLDCRGSGSTAQIIAGLDWVAANHSVGTPAVANLSLGGSASSSFDAAVRAVIDDGVTVTLAAGNEDASACNRSPSRVREALTVAASTRDDDRASYSNYGDCVDLFAPGHQIVSAGTSSASASATKNGTSMAAPHVAGAAAILLSQASLSPAGVAARLLDATTPNVVDDAGPNTPNRLLFVGPGATPTPVQVANPGPQTSIAGTSVRLAMSATGGLTPYRWSAAPLPAGLTIDAATGVISGTPSAAGPPVRVGVVATDAGGATGRIEFDWTVSPAPSSCTGTAPTPVNPGFEQGSTGWAASQGVIAQVGAGAHSGSWNARLAGRGVRGTSTLEQQITIPAGCRTYQLSFWLRVDTTETSRWFKDDTLTVSLGSTVLARYSNLDRSGDYRQRTVNVAGQAGKTLPLTFRATEDQGRATSFAVDDVALTLS